jgi:hypothetical protein
MAGRIGERYRRSRLPQALFATPNNGETLPMISLSGFASGTIWLGTSEATTRLIFATRTRR